MNIKRILAVLLTLTATFILAQSTAEKSESIKDRNEFVVLKAKCSEKKALCMDAGGKKWKISNPEVLRGHEGRLVDLNGTASPKGSQASAENNTFNVTRIYDIACGPRLCERQCKGKCGNGSACDCPRK